MSTSHEIIKVVECGTADELLNALSPRSEYFESSRTDKHEVGQYVFRGLSDAHYQLIPTALRLNSVINSYVGWGKVIANISQNKTKDEALQEEKFILLKDGRVRNKVWTNKDQQQSELIMLVDFFEFADANGLPLPEDSQELRGLLESAKLDSSIFNNTAGYSTWPHENLLSLIALAQHHGIPTRLLDWSRSAYAAAYFAAIDAARAFYESDTNTDAINLAVWAFNVESYKINRMLEGAFHQNGENINVTDRIKIVTAPAASNPNLFAQKGIFTLYDPDRVALDNPVDRRPFDQILEDMGLNNKLFSFRLPIKESPTLLRLLAIEGINGATLFPGYQGSAKAVIEQRYWNLPERVRPHLTHRRRKP